ncbi:MAG: hypothetical protein PHE53_10585 [Thermoguttaceae bacterium]|nr:hypothetical protein [Thermoguttaceae bacterium]
MFRAVFAAMIGYSLLGIATADEIVYENASVRVEWASNGVLTFFQSESSAESQLESPSTAIVPTESLSTAAAYRPFASMLLPESEYCWNSKAHQFLSTSEPRQAITFTGHPEQRFVAMCVAPLANSVKPTTITLNALPTITLDKQYDPNVVKTLGSAGLTAVDGHPGSYMFLAVAEPGSRRGVVAAWLTSRVGSGIVFSGRSSDGKRVEIRAETQYGRREIPTASEVSANAQATIANLGAVSNSDAETSSQSVPLGQDVVLTGETFLVGAFDNCLEGLETYADEVAREYAIKLPPQQAGYCTWYADQFGGAGSEESTRQFADVAAEKLVPFGMTYFQIDDGWQCGQTQNGPKKNFTTHNPSGPYPSGMKTTAEYLNQKGLRAGIWFMSFSGNQDDPYYADKRGWFVESAVDYPTPGERNTRRFSSIDQQKGRPYETFWGGTSLDMTDPNVAAYITEEVTRISHDWGYQYFKYDGMWTAMACEQLYVNDGYAPDDFGLQIFDDMSRTNVECYRMGLQRVRDAAGNNVFILGCNVSQNMRTMGASYGLVDAMRIGPDNGSDWSGICAGPVRGSARYFYNGRVWYNDPDPVYVRDSIPLSRAQLITSWAAVTGQLFAFSDWLPGLSEERVTILQRTIAPHRCYRARPVDLFESKLAQIWNLTQDDTTILGLFNWNEKESLTVNRSLESCDLRADVTYVGYDFWNERFIPPFTSQLTAELPGGTCRVLALRPWTTDHPVVVGTNRHVTSPIFEVRSETWDAATATLSGESDTVVGSPYELRVVMPEGWQVDKATATDGPLNEVVMDGQTLRIRWIPAKIQQSWSVRFQKAP